MISIKSVYLLDKYIFYNQKAGKWQHDKMQCQVSYIAIKFKSKSQTELLLNRSSHDLNGDEIRIYNDFNNDKQGKRYTLPKKLVTFIY